MELLYVWINESKRGFYKQQGFNFSPEFNFIVKEEKKSWILYEDDTWTGKQSIFKDIVIENVSAIVGKNGAGKTTLLEYLIGLDCCSIPDKESYDENYEDLREKEIRENKSIYIFRENENIYIYHNFQNNFQNKTRYFEKNMSKLEVYQNAQENQTDFNDIVKIYITNSGYGNIEKNTMITESKLDTIILTPKKISEIASMYYDKLLDLSSFSSNASSNHDYILKKILKSWRKIDDFQTICDIIYFNKLLKEGRFKDYSINISTKLSISSAKAIRILDNYFIQKHEKNKKLKEICDLIDNNYTKIFTKNENYVTVNLILNLLFEIAINFNIDLPNNISSVKEGIDWIKENLDITLNTKKEYYEEAIKEIEILSRLLKNPITKDNVVPPIDLAYDSSIIFDYEKRPKKYMEFLDFIEERFKAKQSFILRYIKIENIGMSSGERAFLNYFSWINILSKFHNIDANISVKMKSTIMLLVDEIDLYLHPEWQKNCISLLLDEIKKDFLDYKVQIIFTTHSPLCLSDVPNENIIYLAENEGEVLIDDRRMHAQTFGKDVYSLLNDSFYLNNSTMGLFAQKYINNIIQEILDDDNQYKSLSLGKIDLLQKKIEFIGNELLKKKLLSMLQKCCKDKNEELIMLRKEKKMIEQRINELELHKNDRTWIL